MNRRTPDQIVADLQAKIEAVRNREARKVAKSKPEIRLALQAAKALDKALAATQDVTLRRAFEEARTTVATAVAGEGMTLPPLSEKPRGRKKTV